MQERKKLKPEAEAVIAGFQASGFPGWSALGLEQARAAILQMASTVGGSALPVGAVEDIIIENDAGLSTEARLYCPSCMNPRPPVVIYMHGGGFTIGSLEAVDAVVRHLVNASDCAFLSISYRLAPEHKFPAALHDVENAIQWAHRKGHEYGLDPSRLALGGDSSGANLAAAAALLCRDRKGPAIRLQLLVCPALDCNFDTPSHREFGDGVLSAMSRNDVEWFVHNYRGSEADLKNPYFCPLQAENLSGLPEALIVCAEIDPVCDDAIAFASRLEEAGVPVKLQVHTGMFHNFWRMRGILQEAHDTIQNVGEKIRAVMGVSPKMRTEAV